MFRRSLVIIAGMVAVLLPAALTNTAAGAQTDNTYTVTFTNNTTGQYFTPPNFAIHDDSLSLFEIRQPASPGLQAVAENGLVPVLAAEIQGAVDNAGLGVSGVGGGAPVSPGETISFDVTSDQRKFSLISMIVCTNDGFTASNAKNLPGAGETVTYDLRGYDAGTEINTENRADIVPAPFCQDEPGVGTEESNPSLAENGVVRVHRTLEGNGDIPASFDWDNNESIVTVTITNGGDGGAPAPTPTPTPDPTPDPTPTPGDAPTYEIRFVNNTTGQYFTPPNVALHSNDVDVFDLRSPASPGVQAVAENGLVPVLAAELAGAVDAAGEGVSGVLVRDGADGQGPLMPGATASGTFSTDERKFSLVSMIVCTNDGFAGSDAKNLPRAVGETVTYDLRGYDAGTEINTENRADIVPAPFCQDEPGVGTEESNPSLAENGVVRVHRTLEGNGDIPASFDWDNNENIAYVEIVRIG